ncbi:MAG TPA: EB domain-containing protein [Polyangia bacterium]
MNARARLVLRAWLATVMVAGVMATGTAEATPNLDPFRAPAASRAPRFPAGHPASLAVQQPGDPAPAPAATPAPSGARPVGAACQADDQCTSGTICERNVCTVVEPPIHALLFRKDGGSTAFIPFYFSKRGNPGHRVFAPFYWHFWSPESRSRIVAPFYWRFEDHAKQRAVTVIPPYSHTVEPGAESWAVWPIFYGSTKFGWAAPLLGSFRINNPDQGRSYGLYALLYFWKRNERAGTAFDLFVPLFASSRSKASAFTWILPLNFYWRNGEGERAETNLLVLPLFYRGTTPQGGTLVSPVGYYSRSGENRSGSVAWLYWFRRDKNRAHDVVFPLLWSFRGERSSTTILPPFAHLRRPNYTLTTLFPIYWAGKNPSAGTSWRLLLPIYFSRSREQGRVFSWLSPLGGYSRDDDAGTKTFGMWLPPMVFRRDQQTELDMVAGLYWRYKNRTTGSSFLLAGPFYRGTDPGGSTTTLFPLFWHFRDAATGATAHSFFPLYFRRSHPRETLTAGGVFPLWAYYRNHHDGGYGAGIFPLAFFGSRPDRGHGILFPLFWHFRDRVGEATVAAPFFYRFKDRASSNWGIPPLLFFAGSQQRTLGGQTTTDRSYIQFPLFWRFENGRTNNRTTVIPPVYVKTGPTGWSAGVFPLLFTASWAERSHFVLFPLFWHFNDKQADRRSTVVLNYLHRRHGGEVTDALFPLLHFRRGAKPGGSDETSFTLFPLVHYRRDAKSRVFVSPLAASVKTADRKAGLIPPYFWYESRNISASGVPFLYLDLFRKASNERTRTFGPYVAVDTPDTSARILFPLFARYRNPREVGTWVFPTYFRRRGPDDNKTDAFLPLFWYSRSSHHTTTVVGPYYRSKTDKRHVTGLAPLFFYARNEQRRFLLTPLFYDRDNFQDGTGRTIAPLYYRSTRPEGHTTVGFPLYWGSRTRERSFAVLFPVLWHFANSEAKTNTTVLGPLFWTRNKEGARTRGIFPVAWYSRDDERKISSHALLPLFYENHGPTQKSILTLPFGYGRKPDSNFWYVLNVFRRTTATSSFTMVFPLLFNHFNRATDTTTRVIPPLAYFSRSRPDRSLTGAALLFWRHTSIASSTTLALPLFYDVHNYHASRLTMLVPLFMRYWRASDQTAYTLAPLFYRRSSPNDTTTVLFPLYWDFNSGNRRSTVLFPLFASFRRPTYVSRYIFPNIYYRRGEGPAAGTSRLFIFPFWESGAKRRGDTMWEVLLGLFGYERIGRNRYVKVLFFPFQLEPAPAAQTAWYSRPRPAATKPRDRRYGLDARAW